jgi:hypothetical protein
VHGVFLSCEVDACRIWILESRSVSQQDFFHEPQLPGVQFGTIFAVPRLQPARADFRGGHFTGVCLCRAVRDDAHAVGSGGKNNTPAVITGNIVQIARIEARGGFDPNAFYF